MRCEHDMECEDCFECQLQVANRAQLCALHGHALVYEAVFTGETGIETVRCERCGWQRTITY